LRTRIHYLISIGLLASGVTGCAAIPRDLLLDAPETIDSEAFEIGVIEAGSARVSINVDNPGEYATLNLYQGDVLIADSLDVGSPGEHSINALVRLDDAAGQTLGVSARAAQLRIQNLDITWLDELDLPQFVDITSAAGVEREPSLKYGGPTVADLDQDGDYDFILNNHNDGATRLYWNNGDGTVTAHARDLSRWFMHDLHGTAAGDYDNDGDLDLVVTQGGGNGTDPSKANFYTNTDGRLILTTGDVGIDRGGRGRGGRWSDMDSDGDLDLMLVNETGLHGERPQHLFYENEGDGRFTFRRVAGIEDVEPSRALATDLNGDQIDDIILYGPLSVWRGNGDFTFTDITDQFPDTTAHMHDVMAIADLDIDNDGDLDLFLARGKAFEGGRGEAPFVDFDPAAGTFSIRPRGFAGTDGFTFLANGPVRLADYYFLTQGVFRGQDYPIFLGENRARHIIDSGEEFLLEPSLAPGWPSDLSENGVYFGYLGEGRWRASLVRNGDLFWGYQFTLHGVRGAIPDFIPENRNVTDVLLRNDGERFVDVSAEWGIPQSGNSMGVTTGDFNNDGHHDLFVYRWGYIRGRISDLMLLNNGQGGFEQFTMHGASDLGGPGNGDMGQAFDFDLDGDLDLLSGGERGDWNLHENREPGSGHYALVRVGYSPTGRIDSIGAEVTVETAASRQLRRVGSAGEIFSQSLLNIVHFGLGDNDQIERITVRWRNGEIASFAGKPADQLFDTDLLDPLTLNLTPTELSIRTGTSHRFATELAPLNADSSLIWRSSDPASINVAQDGTLHAVGEAGETAIITATSSANGLAASATATIVNWFPVPVEEVRLTTPAVDAFTGQTIAMQATVLPSTADERGLIWSSSDPAVASVDQNGVVQLLSAGEAEIVAASLETADISAARTLQVEPFSEPSIRIIAEEALAEGLVAGDDMEVRVQYDAGSGNTVIASDEGGVRFWLRHFRSEWIPERDITHVDESAIGSRRGQSSQHFSLAGLTPSSDLPEGHFYQLRVSFATSDGRMIDKTITPLVITAPREP